MLKIVGPYGFNELWNFEVPTRWLAEKEFIMRITRRYRVVKPVRFFISILVTVLILIFTITTFVGSSTEATSTETYRQVVVHENETIWTIAEENCSSNKDIRVQVNEICEINNIQAGDVQPGDTLIVPVES